jgi:hypothetical protein
MRLPGFGGGASTPPPPSPPPERDDPRIAEAKNKLRQSELKRRGRRASILTKPEEDLGEANISRPQASATFG